MFKAITKYLKPEEKKCHVVRPKFSLVEKKNGGGKGGRNLEKETYFCIEKNRKGGKYLEKIITFCVELVDNPEFSSTGHLHIKS